MAMMKYILYALLLTKTKAQRTSFFVMNGNQEVGPLVNGMIVDVGVYKNVSIKATSRTLLGRNAGSVKFKLNGKTTNTDKTPPFLMDWNATVGNHTADATGFRSKRGSGVKTGSKKVFFSVIKSKTLAPVLKTKGPTNGDKTKAPSYAFPVSTKAPMNAVPVAPAPVPVIAKPIAPVIAPKAAVTVAPVPAAVKPIAPVVAPKTATIPYTCGTTKDTCPFKFNGFCNVGPDACDANTDCFDCDPCRKYAFTSCTTCTSAPERCLWCSASASCISPGTAVPVSMSCNMSDHRASCTNSSLPTGPFSDPFFNQMLWLYDMINVREVWKAGVTGKGIGIRINDNGVDSSHPEFRSKFDTRSSCTLYAPEGSGRSSSHGTTCASLAAGSGNSSCSVGIAPDATLSGCRILATVATPERDDWSYLHVKMDNMHVSSNSYGYAPCNAKRRRNLKDVQACPFLSASPLSPCLSVNCAGVDWSDTGPSIACEYDVIEYCRDSINFEQDVQGCSSFLDLFVKCRYNSPNPIEIQAHIEGITNGRNGKGIVYVYAAGNDFGTGDDVNFQSSLNSRYVISVGAVGQDKVHASYSTPGAALFVSAPGGDDETSPTNIVALAGGGCTDGGVGTSFACPVVSGVVALILQVNSNLGWRDVQGLIASTSQKVAPSDPSWTTNGAGFHHSYLYGFGLVDASAAVKAAKTWVNYKTEQMLMADSGPVNVPVTEFQFPSVVATSSIKITAPANFKIESVIVYIDLSHSSRGDLDIILVSPQSTMSLLAPGKRPENTQLTGDERWKLMTVRNWGESPNGNWTLRLVDRKLGDLSTCINQENYFVDIVFPYCTIPTTCLVLEIFGACVNGAQSPTFYKSDFAEVAKGIDDPMFTMSNGLTAASACCVCGGGQLASAIPDVLKSWRIAVYGSVK